MTTPKGDLIFILYVNSRCHRASNEKDRYSYKSVGAYLMGGIHSLFKLLFVIVVGKMKTKKSELIPDSR